MQEQPPDDIAKAVRCGLGGPTSFHEEVGLPFVKELVEELGAEGFDEHRDLLVRIDEVDGAPEAETEEP